MKEIQHPSRRPIATLTTCVAALAIGSLALAIQIVCTRIAMQHFGSGTTTISSMIAMSLVGLAAGAYFVGKRADSTKRLGTWIGVLFVVCAVCSIGIAEFGRTLAEFLDDRLNPGIGQIGLAQILFAAITMLPINFSLGGILPSLVKKQNRNQFKQNGFSLIYACETIGAAVGSFATAFWLVQSCGLGWTLRFSALLAAIFGGGFLLLGRSNSTLETEKEAQSKSSLDGWSKGLFLAIVGLAGCATLGIEVVWQRFFVVWFGSDTQSYAIVVMTFMIGISFGAFGSGLVTRLSSSVVHTYSLILVAIAMTLLATTVLLSAGIDMWLMGWAGRWLLESPLLSRIVLAISLMLIPTNLIGIGLPVAANVWLGDSREVGRKVGEVYAVALMGNVFGVLFCGYLLVPNLGLRNSAILLSAICLACGLALSFVNSQGLADKTNKTPVNGTIKGRFRFRALLFVAVGGWLISAIVISGNDFQLGLKQTTNQWVTDFYSEGSQNTVAVVHDKDDPQRRKMVIDGVSIGESRGGVEQKQLLLAHLPFLVQPKLPDRKILTIGLGTGILAAELLANDETKSVSCVELLPTVVEAAKHFRDLNGDLLRQPNFKLVQADGIQYLRKSKQVFDAIVSDAKSRPGHSGNIAFFSRDYYQLCNSSLSNSGVFVQWISLKTSGPALQTILKSFSGVFPYGHLAIVAPDSVFAIGTKTPMRLDRSYVDQYLAETFFKSWRQYGFNGFDDMLSFYWLDQGVIEKVLADVDANTFELPLLEKFALDSISVSTLKSSDQLAVVEELVEFDLANRVGKSVWNSSSVESLSDANSAEDLSAGRKASMEIIYASRQLLDADENWLDLAAAGYRRAMALLPGLTRQQAVATIYRQLADKANQSENVNLEFSSLLNIKELNCSMAEDEFRLGTILSQQGREEESLEYFYAAVKRSPDHPIYRTGFGFCLLELKKYGQASSQFRRVLANDETQSGARAGLGIAQLSLGQTKPGHDNIDRALSEDSKLKSRLIEMGINLDAF